MKVLYLVGCYIDFAHEQFGILELIPLGKISLVYTVAIAGKKYTSGIAHHSLSDSLAIIKYISCCNGIVKCYANWSKLL